MSPTEIELQPNYKWRMALVFLIVTALLYLMLGYLPTIIWIAMPIVALSLIVASSRDEAPARASDSMKKAYATNDSKWALSDSPIFVASVATGCRARDTSRSSFTTLRGTRRDDLYGYT